MKETYILDNDQPTTCPKCGKRTDWTDNEDGSQDHKCLGCGYEFRGEFEPREERQLIVAGSYGELIVDGESGKVLDYEPFPYEPPEYADIVRFDVEEFRHFYFDDPDCNWADIVDIGFWTDKGDFIAPETEHRFLTLERLS